jgi:hypothetical protein
MAGRIEGRRRIEGARETGEGRPETKDWRTILDIDALEYRIQKAKCHVGWSENLRIEKASNRPLVFPFNRVTRPTASPL